MNESDYILVFFDLRDAMDFVIWMMWAPEPSRLPVEYIKFCCQMTLRTLKKIPSTTCLCFTVKVDSLDEDIEELKQQIRDFFPCLVSKETFSSTRDRRIRKFFVDVMDARLVDGLDGRLQEAPFMKSPELTIEWSMVDISMIDRDYLFYVSCKEVRTPSFCIPDGIWSNYDSHSSTATTPSPKAHRASSANSHSGSSSFSNFESHPKDAFEHAASCKSNGVDILRGYMSTPASITLNNQAITEVKEENDYEIDFSRIKSGQDTRTTCMIRNIPNKYTQVNIFPKL